MTVRDDDIRQRLRLGEDSRWEFKQIEFRGDRPVSPRPDDLADELAAFANTRGGVLVCGVTDAGEVQGMSRAQMDALDRILSETCADSIKPPIDVDITRHELGDGQALIVVEVPPGQSRFLWFDKQPVQETGFETLSERLWKPLVSVAGAADPRRALRNLRLLAPDEGDVLRATVAGILLCTETPERWFPNAAIMATCYRGADRASGQLDAQEIVGPAHHQIADAVKFALRNMRVAARKTPARIDVPQYSSRAIFEALVNAVAHRDYSMAGQRIRLSMFDDRLEIDSPGALPNGMTVANIGTISATRNEVIASVFGRLPVGGIPGSDDRQFLMERRGDGVMIIVRETRETSGKPPAYELIDESNLQLTIPAAELEPTPARTVVTVRSAGLPLAGVDILMVFPDRTWRRATTDEAGEAAIELHSTHLPMTVYAAAPGHAAHVEREWVPNRQALALELPSLPHGGAAIVDETADHLPGLGGRLDPTIDAHDRTYLYADNISINHGMQQPVYFAPGEELRLTDNSGYELLVKIVDIAGRSALVEYRLPHP